MLQILDFYADWCGPCQAMKPIFEEVEKEYAGKVEFKKVDVELEGAVAQEYGVVSIPTFVILEDGKEIDRKMGAMPEGVLKEWLDSKLN